MKTLMKLSLLFVLACSAAFGQLTTTSTTLSAAITANTTAQWCIGSATGVTLPSLSTGQQGSYLWVDREASQVMSQGASSTCYNVKRGQLGTTANASHSSGGTVYVGGAGTGSGDPSRPFTGVFIVTAPTGSCIAAAQYSLPVIVTGIGGQTAYVGSLWDCKNGQWVNSTPVSQMILTCNNQVSGTSPSAAAACLTVTGGTGGAQSATTGNGAAGSADSITGGTGGIGGSSSGTAGTGGAVSEIGGAGGAGPITGGTGGAVALGGGVGGAGSTAGGTGGGVNIYSGAAGAGGTGTSGAVNIRSGGAAGTAVLSTSTAGATTVASAGTAQSVTLTPSTSGTIKVTGGSDPTKIVSIDASGNTTAVTETLAFGASTARTATFPDASITVSGASGSDCGTSAGACSVTAIGPTLKIIRGTAAATSASPSTVAITGMSPAFTSTTTFSCFASNATTVANVFSVLTAGYVSTSAVTFTGPNTLTDTIRWTCIGY